MSDPVRRFAVGALVAAPVTLLFVAWSAYQCWRTLRGGGRLDVLAGDT